MKRIRPVLALCFGLCAAADLPLSQEAGEEASKEPTAGGEVTAGAQGVRENPPDSAKFYEYREVPAGFVAENIRFFWIPRPSFFLTADAWDIAQQDTRGIVDFGRTDLWRASIVWSDNPRRWGDDTRMLFADRGNARFTLPDALQLAVQGAGANVDVAPPLGEWDPNTRGAVIKQAIEEGAQDVELGYQRRQQWLGFTVTPGRLWTFDASVARERRGGTNPQSLGNYFTLSPAEVAAPVDFRTDWETLRGEYHARLWNAGAQLTASQFDTGFESLTWDNQLALADTPDPNSPTTAIPGRERLTLGTDNRMVQAVVFGGVNLPARTRLDATVSISEVRQNDRFFPMTTNSILLPQVEPLPEERFDGRHRYEMGYLRAAGRPNDWLRWSAWARHWELDNRSPSLEFPSYVMTDFQIPFCSNVNACGALTNPIARRSLPYGWQKDWFGAQAGFRATGWLDVLVGYELRMVEREHAGVEESDEDVYKVAFDMDLGGMWNVRATARRLERRADDYHAEYNEESFPIGEPYVAPINEGSRRYIWTDRDRSEYSLLVDFTPMDRLALYAEATYAKSKYYDPLTGRRVGDSFETEEDRNFDGTPETYEILLAGRTFDRYISYTLGFATPISNRLRFYGDVTWEDLSYRLDTRYRAPVAGIGSDNPLDNWGSDAKDTYVTVTVGAGAALDKAGRWNLNVDASRWAGEGKLSTDFVPGGNASGNTTLTRFPDLTTTLTIAQASLNHRISRSFDATLRWWYELWHENNWASDQMQPYMGDPGNDPGSATAIYLGMDFDDYEYHVVSLMGRYRF
jgi:MtrB/PioB family decaheme-associated outer membrane protein